MEELITSLVCCEVGMGAGGMPSSTCPSPIVVVWQSSLRIMKVGELSLLLIGCSTWECRPSTSSWRNSSTAGLVKGEQISQSLPQSKEELTLPLICHEVAWVQG